MLLLTRRFSTGVAAAALALSALVGGASADVIFNPGTPDGGFFGFIGDDIFPGQSVGVAFSPSQSYTLDQIGAWIMSNDFDAPGRTYTLTLRTNSTSGGPTTPSNTILESWNLATAAVGWNPVLDEAPSLLHPLLSAGTTYWVVAESNEPAGLDPVWVWSGNIDPVYSALDEHDGQGWMGTYTEGSCPGVVVEGTLVPGPGAIALLSLAGLTAMRRRR